MAVAVIVAVAVAAVVAVAVAVAVAVVVVVVVAVVVAVAVAVIVVSRTNVHKTKHAQQQAHATANMQGTLLRRIGMCTRPSMHNNQRMQPQTCTARCRVTYKCAQDLACMATRHSGQWHLTGQVWWVWPVSTGGPDSCVS